MRAIHKKRLLNVARALRESPAPDEFTMEFFGSAGPCSTPHCALGHYATRLDLQRAFGLMSIGCNSFLYLCSRADPEREVGYTSANVARHFGLSLDECEELFSQVGCGRAETAEQAALYIERFVASKERGGAGSSLDREGAAVK